MRLEFARAALADLDAIYRYGIAKFGSAKADSYAGLLAAALDLVLTYPAVAPLLPARDDGLRCRSAGVHSIFYTAEADLVRIVRVLHQQMDAKRHI